jgi:hypothetical protein
VDEVKQFLADLRGGIPGRCDFCNEPMTEDDAVPEEGGDWACIRCWERWEKEDAAASGSPLAPQRQGHEPSNP